MKYVIIDDRTRDHYYIENMDKAVKLAREISNEIHKDVIIYKKHFVVYGTKEPMVQKIQVKTNAIKINPI